MSISPSTDIVLDVARAADPTRYKEAAARLQELASFAPTSSSTARAVGGAFDAALARAGGEESPADAAPKRAPTPLLQLPFDSTAALTRLKSDTALSGSPGGSGIAAPGEVYRDFEAMFLTNFVETILPQSSESVFGAGSAGQMWRSMLAQQIAQQVADAGGVGLADQLADRAATRSGGNGLV